MKAFFFTKIDFFLSSFPLMKCGTMSEEKTQEGFCERIKSK